MNTDSPQDYFKLILLTVVRGAFEAAGYALTDSPTQHAGGLFRFRKALDDGLFAFIEFQHLHYVEGSPSRFRVTLTRTDNAGGAASDHPAYVRKTLSELVVRDFGVAILPSADHWWTFQNVDQMGKALGEAGHLVVGYGMPYLAGDLVP